MILYALGLGLGLAMDAFAVSVTNGLCAGRVKLRHALMDGLTFGLFQAAMPLIGFFLGLSFMKYIKPVDHWVAFILLGGIGLNMIIGVLKKEEEEACPVSPFTVKNILIQGVATSIDALAVGIGFSGELAGYGEAFLTVGIIGLSTFAISTAGVYIGKLFGGFLREKAQILGGLILIGIGAKILIQHLFF